MPGCAAVSCSNSSEKGFIMKQFPKDPERRKEWAANMHRGNWKLTDYNVLCETHFEADVWEKVTVDGTIKLRCNAIPTLFAHKKPVIHRKPPVKRVTAPFTLEKKQLPMTTMTCDPDPNSTNFDVQSIKGETSLSDEAESTVEDATRDSSPLQDLLLHYRTQVRKLHAKHHRYRNIIMNLRRQVGTLQYKLKKMDEQNGTEENAKLLKSVFNDDQISALKQPSKRSRKRSYTTVYLLI